MTVWAMVEFEADDALATAAARAAADAAGRAGAASAPPTRTSRSASAARVVQLDRRAETHPRRGRRAREVRRAGPASIPDWLALVGDSADGFPGLPGWGAKTAAAVLARYGHLDAIPDDAGDWDVAVRGAARLAQALVEGRELAELFRVLATLRTDAAGVLSEDVEELRWRGPAAELPAVCEDLDAPDVLARAEELAAARG